MLIPGMNILPPAWTVTDTLYKLIWDAVNSCFRSVLPWDALPVRGTLFLPVPSRPFSPVPTTSFVLQPSQTAASICVAPTAACPLVSEMPPVNCDSVALSFPHPPTSLPNSPFYPSHTSFFPHYSQEINVSSVRICDPLVPSNPVLSLT